jgi:hypothetical protein
MSTTTASHTVGERVELGRYEITAGSRILYGQRVDGVVRLTDHPAVPGFGRCHLVERGLEQDGHAALQALVEEYILQSTWRDEPAILIPPAHPLAA